MLIVYSFIYLMAFTVPIISVSYSSISKISQTIWLRGNSSNRNLPNRTQFSVSLPGKFGNVLQIWKIQTYFKDVHHLDNKREIGSRINILKKIMHLKFSFTDELLSSLECSLVLEKSGASSQIKRNLNTTADLLSHDRYFRIFRK